MKKEYSNGNLTVTWEAEKCIHSTNCWKGLVEVFNPKKRPWINLDAAADQAIAKQVDRCPSGALGYFYNALSKPDELNVERRANTIIATNIPSKEDLEAGKSYAWCACGRSDKQPFCNGAHNQTDLKPLVFKPKESGGAWLCQCKQTSTPPFCDGSHNSLS